MVNAAVRLHPKFHELNERLEGVSALCTDKQSGTHKQSGRKVRLRFITNEAGLEALGETATGRIYSSDEPQPMMVPHSPDEAERRSDLVTGAIRDMNNSRFESWTIRAIAEDAVSGQLLGDVKFYSGGGEINGLCLPLPLIELSWEFQKQFQGQGFGRPMAFAAVYTAAVLALKSKGRIEAATYTDTKRNTPSNQPSGPALNGSQTLLLGLGFKGPMEKYELGQPFYGKDPVPRPISGYTIDVPTWLRESCPELLKRFDIEFVKTRTIPGGESFSFGIEPTKNSVAFDWRPRTLVRARRSSLRTFRAGINDISASARFLTACLADKNPQTREMAMAAVRPALPLLGKPEVGDSEGVVHGLLDALQADPRSVLGIAKRGEDESIAGLVLVRPSTATRQAAVSEWTSSTVLSDLAEVDRAEEVIRNRLDFYIGGKPELGQLAPHSKFLPMRMDHLNVHLLRNDATGFMRFGEPQLAIYSTDNFPLGNPSWKFLPSAAHGYRAQVSASGSNVFDSAVLNDFASGSGWLAEILNRSPQHAVVVTIPYVNGDGEELLFAQGLATRPMKPTALYQGKAGWHSHIVGDSSRREELIQLEDFAARLKQEMSRGVSDHFHGIGGGVAG